jgi:hypothetical protein
MPLTARQALIRDCIAREATSRREVEVVYCTEWLGILPYAAYQWLECGGHDLGAGLPSGWDFADLAALEGAGFLVKAGEWQDPEDSFHRRVTFLCSTPRDPP